MGECNGCAANLMAKVGGLTNARNILRECLDSRNEQIKLLEFRIKLYECALGYKIEIGKGNNEQ